MVDYLVENHDQRITLFEGLFFGKRVCMQIDGMCSMGSTITLFWKSLVYFMELSQVTLSVHCLLFGLDLV